MSGWVCCTSARKQAVSALRKCFAPQQADRIVEKGARPSLEDPFHVLAAGDVPDDHERASTDRGPGAGIPHTTTPPSNESGVKGRRESSHSKPRQQVLPGWGTIR